MLAPDNKKKIDSKGSLRFQTKVNQDPRVQVALDVKVAEDFWEKFVRPDG
jgi:hypothetical protein